MKKHLDFGITAAIFVAALVYYGRQVCPTFYFWDSAELTAAVMSGGIPHPPGFPLYLILAKLFCLIMPFDHGFALGLFSAVCGAGSVAVFYLICLNLLKGNLSNDTIARILAFGGSLILVTTASLTAQSTRAEVYTLNLLLFLIAFYFLSKLITVNKNGILISRYFILASLFIGMGLANHHLTMLLALPALIYLAVSLRVKARVIFGSVVALLVPVTLYVYLIFLAGKSPDLNWGNPTNLGGLIAVITGKGFNTPISAFSISHLSENIAFDISLLYRQIGPIVAVLSLIGLYSAFKTSKRIFSFLLICIMFNLFSTIFNEYYYYENTDLHGYLLISIVATIIVSLIGLRKLIGRIPKRFSIPTISLTLAIAVIVPAYANIGWGDLRGNYSAKRLAETYIKDCPRGALVITSSYNTYFILKAAQNACGYRKDLLVLNVYLFGQGWYRDDIARRCNLQHASMVRTDANSFYRALINLYKDSSEICIEYDNQSASLRNYLALSGLMMKFTKQVTDWDKVDKAGLVVSDLKNITNLVSPGMDYELLKSVILILDNRNSYFRAIGQAEMAVEYSDEIDKIAALAKK